MRQMNCSPAAPWHSGVDAAVSCVSRILRRCSACGSRIRKGLTHLGFEGLPDECHHVGQVLWII